jgi:hypothetical protein
MLAPMLGASYASSSVQLSLLITPALASVPSDGLQHPAFYVSVVDSSGNPRALQKNINVTTSSSDNSILKVPSNITMGIGSYYTIVYGSSTILVGKSVQVSVSSSGFQSGTATISVAPPAGTPISLKITLLPNTVAPLVGSESDVVVTIVDAYNQPAKARTNINVTLSSSNLQIADLIPRTITVSKGNFSAMAKIKTTGFVGSTSITASSSNLQSDTQTFTVSGPKPQQIDIWSPTDICTNESVYIPVMVTDQNLEPAKLPFKLNISLYSTNTSIISVQSRVVIGIEQWYALATITSSNITGSATIYASAENISSTNIVVNVVRAVGPPKFKNKSVTLKIYSLANYFPADGINYTGLMVQLVNASGYPTWSNVSKVINLFSTNNAILAVPATATILANQSIVYIPVIPVEPGSVQVSVVASGFIGTQCPCSVYEPIPSSMQIVVPPVPAGGEVTGCLYISGGGGPAPVQQNTVVTLSSSNTKVAEVDATSTLLNKNYTAEFKVTGVTPGSFSLSASGPGIPSGSMQVQISQLRPSNFFVSTIKPLVGMQFPIITQIISSSGPPAVLDEPVQIEISSSNTTAVSLPTTVQIQAEKSETIVYGTTNSSTSITSVTIASVGFTSSTLQLQAISYKGSLVLVSNKTSSTVNSAVTIQAIVTLGGNPVSGVKVFWKGQGLLANNSITGSFGNCSNLLTLKHGQNDVGAYAVIPGVGYVNNVTEVQGLNEYVLETSSNVNVNVNVAPSALEYKEGLSVTLTAPNTVAMNGLIGLLGGKYDFNKWTGFINSQQNPMNIVFLGGSTTLTVRAIYVEDLTFVYVWLAVIILIVAVIGFFFFRRWYMLRPPKEEKETEASETLEETVTETKTEGGKEKETGESKDVKESSTEEKKDDNAKGNS